MNKALPPFLTSYDLLKGAALLLMIVDHVGYYFFPEDQWLRVIGRFSAPVWLFLIGFARSRDLSVRMWAGMGVLLLSNYVAGMAILPVNILGTMILCRILIDPLMRSIERNPRALYPIVIALFVLTFPTFAFIEYGTSAMLIVMTGYMVRHHEALPFSRNDILQFAGIAGLLYAFMQIISFLTFNDVERMAVAVGLMGLMLCLTGFRPRDYPGLTARLPEPLVALVRLAGRRTLEFYVLHLILFKAVAFWLGIGDMQLFNLHIW